ncbi:fimbrial-like adhesin protein StcD [Escherichia coli]|uniref:Fimbrial-like adhesin protein StcD n=1 Tax=Escherichia coli TaxID=562 RepID=A0A377BSW7_ECOLX|nr:fimbrial-like adhesin protein StcD [Escherichia coli]
MEIRIMLFILMMMVMPVSYAAFIVSYLFSTNLVFRGICTYSNTNGDYEHNFNDSSCVSNKYYHPMSPSDIIVGLYKRYH